MYYPDIDQFKTLSSKGNLIPVYKEIIADTETPVSAFIKIDTPPSFLLESVTGGEKWARYSFLGVSPIKVFKAWGNRVEISEDGKVTTSETFDDPINVLKDEISAYRPVHIEGLPPFYGGLVGYIGYETVKFFESVPDRDKPSLDLPDIFFMLTNTILIFDNLKQTIKVLSNAHISDASPEDVYNKATEEIEKIIKKLRSKSRNMSSVDLEVTTGLNLKIDNNPIKDYESKSSSDVSFSTPFNTRDDFLSAVSKCKEYIKDGDVIQVVISQRFETDSDVNPFNIYRRLRVINPSPYMFYINTDELQIAGSSPEILVRLDEDRIVLRPIAGTRKRGDTDKEDKELETDLKNDPKERAEHLMLVDLGRNDVGRVAKIGSVNVTEFMTIEKYSHVMHLVSNVEGIIKDGLDSYDVLRACFPAGTVTGAPKVRAMEIINGIEPIKRGPYAGAVGYFSFSGNMDICITIRTIIIKDGKVYIQTGAGIVADSIPENEYAETVNKASGMMRAVQMAAKNSH